MRCSGVSRLAALGRLARIAGFGLGSLAAASVACTSDDASTESPDAGVDASADATTDGAPAPIDASGDEAAPGAIAARINDVDVYLGQPASLVATVTPPPASATYAWELTQAAAGSALTTATLGAIDGPSLHFVPDVRGDYALKITVTAGGA